MARGTPTSKLSSIPANRLCQPLLNAIFRRIAQALRAADVRQGVPDVASPGRLVSRRDFAAQDLTDRLGQGVQADALAAGDVEDSSAAAAGQDVRLDHVGHIDKVSGLLAVPKNCGLALRDLGQKMQAEL